MIFTLIVMAIVAKVLHSKGCTFERMLPILLIAGIIAFFIPVGSIIALPFKIIGGVFGAVFGGLGGLLGGVFGLIGGTIGVVFGVIGAVIGLVFGAIGLVFGLVTMLLIPLAIIFVVVKLVT